jgi:hypothetical protein
MSVLFTVENRVVIPHTETLLIPPFQEIWERDTTLTKENAMEDFKYMEFMVSVKKSNPYRGYDEHIRRSKIIQDCIKRDSWMEDDLIKYGMERIKEFQTDASLTYSYFMSIKCAAEKMKDFFNTFDMSTLNPKTLMPMYKPREITSALNDTSKVLENLDKTQKKVEEEIFESTKKRGDKVISPFAMK